MRIWKKAAALAGLVAAAWALLSTSGSWRWRQKTRALRAQLPAGAGTAGLRTVDFGRLAELPPPVQRYLRKVLVEGAPTIAAVRLKQEGEFNMSEEGNRWAPFSADQWVRIRPPGFDWDARIRLLPGVSVRVHDAYVAGEGILHAAMLGLFPLVNLQGKGEIAKGELMRFLAEAAWYPTALLPGQGVRWTAVDAGTARAALDDGEISVELLFRFNAEDLIQAVEAEARGRMVNRQIVASPWAGRFWGYERRSGMLVPLQGEVAWLFPDGPRPYWRGRMTKIEYRFTE